jgi:hypothetical protein
LPKSPVEIAVGGCHKQKRRETCINDYYLNGELINNEIRRWGKESLKP